MANPGDATTLARSTEAPKPAESLLPAAAHVFTPAEMCPGVFQRNPVQDATTLSQLGLATSDQLMSWVKPDGKDNPAPSSWVKDDKNHVTQAGDKFQATYDAAGNLTSASIGTDSYAKTGKDQVTETYRGHDGKSYQDVTNGVTDFSAKPWNNEWHGKAAGMEIKVSFGSGSSKSESSTLFEDSAHQVTDNSFWNVNQVCKRLDQK